MKYLKNIWAERIPSYDSSYQWIFDRLANKANEGGDREEAATEAGKVFATQYELYIYAFFIGLYSNERRESIKKVNFGHKISEWGKKNRKSMRESFLEIQDFMFISLIFLSDVDFIELERSLDEGAVKIAVSNLNDLMESYTNGGLQLIKEKLESNDNYFISSLEASLNFLLKISVSV